MRSIAWLVVGACMLLAAPVRAADFSVTVPTCCSSYSINGQANPSLTLVRGHAYTFDVSAAGHPFYIKTAQVTGTGSTWDEGVVNNGTTSGTVTFTVPTDAPSTLFYQCAVHSPMTGAIAISNHAPAAGTPAVGLLALAMGVAGWFAVRRRLPSLRLGRAR
jgi:hypothetical protein